MLDDKKMCAVRDLIMEEDQGGLVAASFFSLKSKGLLNEEAATRILTGRPSTTAADEEAAKDSDLRVNN